MKKQIKSNAKSNQAKDKNLAPGIQTFFKSAPKDFVVENVGEEKSNDGIKTFYVDILKEKLRHVRGKECVTQDENGNNEVHDEADGACAVVMEKADGACAVVMEKADCNVRSTKDQVESEGYDSKTECAGCVEKAVARDEWEEKYKLEVEKRKSLKKVYLNLTIRFSELDSKYNDLLKTATRTYQQSVDDDVVTSRDIFTTNEVKFLQSMLLDRKTDCTFIHTCLKYAYKLDPSVLVSKTLKGTPEWTEISNEGKQIHHGAKTPVTPKKADRIKGLFIERISKCKIDSAEYTDRMKEPYVNKLIAGGIKNIAKKYK